MRSGFKVQPFGVSLASLLVLTACGQGPAFGAKSKGLFATDKNASSSSDSTAPNPESELPPLPPTNGSGTGGSGDVVVTPPSEAKPTSPTATPPAATPGDNPGTMPTIPGAKPTDLDALHRCLAAWPNNPFLGTAKVEHFKEIYASVSVLSSGAAINDTENTPFPELILVDAGVNVLGSPTYNLLNKNGYYCIRVNVNVITKLGVNLHCNARLADSKVDVNVLSTQNDTTAGVGVNVLSDVKVTTVRPQGDSCVR
ncbi:MAG: hypothetical protein NTZ90_03355 [Proteobacteria bacterium]|nr:hypothetical protein [Pseudomonadota bacterium]